MVRRRVRVHTVLALDELLMDSTANEATDVAAPAETAPPLEPLRSVHTSSFADILSALGVSIVVSTYQAGKLVVLRADGGKINTHFRPFPHPMGIATQGDRLSVGGGMRIWELHNLPAVAAKLDPAGKHDACFLPRAAHMTGDVQIHEMEYGTDGLWFVNTRFSCLATLDAVHSFVPRWRPPFISALAPEDRCHLNGLCVVDGTPCFVTALGETDRPGGWRKNKKSGGVVIEVSTGRTLVRGLCMPHSPRWFDRRLWVLESGTGGLGYIEPRSLQYEPIANLPGFTRGLDFYDRFAFVGLSQVRETAIFSGIPITDENLERRSGVWVVDVRSGQIVAWLRFEEAVQEVFAVRVLPGMTYPEIVGDFHTLNADSFELPNFALDYVPAELASRWRLRDADPRENSSLDQFAADYAWPSRCPTVAAMESHGWLSDSTRELLASVLGDETTLIVELGSWLGLSTRFIADCAPNATVIAVDHWLGSAEHRDRPELAALLPMLYQTFLRNCWDYRGRVIPCRMDVCVALEELANRGLTPDVVYLDAAHDFETVLEHVQTVRKLFPAAVLIGDDWDWQSVRLAATRAADAEGATIVPHGTAWQYLSKAPAGSAPDDGRAPILARA